MAERTERSVLNHVITSCKDGARGLQYAADHVKDTAVRALFREMTSQRERFAGDLLPHAQRLGGANESEGTTAATLHRGWMTISDALASDIDEAIIREVERGETAALAVYQDALEGMLSQDARDLIEQQFAEIRQCHDRIRLLRLVDNIANWIH
jgi:uncharacterized protein (TIGR02284 family)